MATVAEPLVEDDWQQIPASWRAYRRLLRDRGERGRPKYTYVDRRLTIVSPGTPHEVLKKRVGGLIEDICIGLSIDYLSFGESTYLKFKKGKAGTEPDESYYLTNIDKMIRAERVVIGRDPAPDLCVEVAFSHPAEAAVEVYRRFGVREIWVCDRAELVIHMLGEDCQFLASPVSACFPFLSAAELNSWVYLDEPATEMKLRRQFRAWVEVTLRARLTGE